MTEIISGLFQACNGNDKEKDKYNKRKKSDSL